MMNSNYFSKLALSGICLISLAACSDEDFGHSKEEIAREVFEKEYQANFEREYGKISAGHTWGFDNPTTKAETRGYEYTNRYKLIRRKDVRYWIEGYQKEDGTWEQGHEEFYDVSVEHNSDGSQGGLQMDEVLYAARNCPPVITQAEKDYVFKYLRDNPNKGSIDCDLDNYFLQDLGQDPYTGDHGGKGTGHMDNLHFDNAHFDDYNAGSGPDYYAVKTKITDPYYQDSKGTVGIEMRDHYRFYYIPANPSENFNGGTYLCFDYEAYKEEDHQDNVPRDYYFNDWVIKVTPGEGETHFVEYRVFCEDLGSTHDLDFNDLVFDYVDFGVSSKTGKGSIAINVIGLEGTLPISIEGTPIKEDLLPHHNVTQDVIYVSKNDISLVNIIVETSDKGTCFMTNTPGKAPYLIRCNEKIDWPAEGQRIENKYPLFPFYATDVDNYPYWWKPQQNTGEQN